MNFHKIAPLFILIASITFAMTPAKATLLVYEGFEYSAGAIDGSQNGGVGMTGAWTTTNVSTGTQFSMVSGALAFPGLDTNGTVRATRASAPGGGEMSRQISGASQSALTGDNTTIWFSVLVRNDRFSVGNENFAFVLGSGAFDVNGPDGTPPNITGGSGFGIHLWPLDPNDSTIDIYGYQIDNGVTTRSTGKVDNDTSVETFLLVGRIDWNPLGTDDVLTLYNITGNPAGPLPAPFAVMNADLDQSQFDTLAIASRQIASIDEIRFGTTALSVGVTPEPSKAILLLVGFMGWFIRRRRSA